MCLVGQNSYRCSEVRPQERALYASQIIGKAFFTPARQAALLCLGKNAAFGFFAGVQEAQMKAAAVICGQKKNLSAFLQRGFLNGVGKGIRTHDPQGHNLVL